MKKTPMKRTASCALTLLFMMIFGAARSQQNAGWNEMISFRNTAMESFHSAEAGNLTPVRDSSTAILQKAKAWQASATPAPCNKKQVDALLLTLTQQCQAISDDVTAKKPDKELRPFVMKAHDTFHLIVSKCK